MDAHFDQLREWALDVDGDPSARGASAFFNTLARKHFLTFYVLVREPDFPARFLINLFRPRPSGDFTEQEMRALEARARHVYDFARKNAVRSSMWPTPEDFVQRHREVAHAGWRSMAALIEKSIGSHGGVRGASI